MKKKLLAMILSAAMMVTAAPEATVFASDMDYAASAVAEEILEEEELVGEAADEADASEEVVETESEDTAEFDASIPAEAPADAEVTEEVPSVETISDDVFNYSVNEKQEAVVTGLKAADAAFQDRALSPYLAQEPQAPRRGRHVHRLYGRLYRRRKETSYEKSGQGRPVPGGAECGTPLTAPAVPGNTAGKNSPGR